MREWRLGVRATDISPFKARAWRAGRPLLVIEDGADIHVTPDNQRELFSVAGEATEYWVALGASHGKGHTAAKAEYERRELAFWERVFRR